jgi:3D (Asp-Asp-Asp) domain-containing protein
VGDIPQLESHGKRSSSMSFAMRWKHENLRFISLTAFIALALTFMFLLMLYGTSMKEITLVVNGEEKTVVTRQWQLDRLLEEQSITIGYHDRISVPARGRLENGDRLVIDQTHPLTLQSDGRQDVVYTVGGTVEEALADLQIILGEYDRTIPALDAAVQPGDRVRIIRVTKVLEEQEKDIPFTVVTKNDAALAKGKEKVVTEGKEGVLLEKVELTYEDGILASQRVLDTTIAQASVDEVVAVGTRKPVTVLSASSPTIQEVTKKGITFGVKQILSEVILTAYHAGIESTGKTPEHPQYGITFSGTTVSEGRTVAVDPKVIPIGWWVYIEGYGFRRAEDKGSGVKGKHIDIYYESGETAKKFGKKRGATVYIVGPKKPETN